MERFAISVMFADARVRKKLLCVSSWQSKSLSVVTTAQHGRQPPELETCNQI